MNPHPFIVLVAIAFSCVADDTRSQEIDRTKDEEAIKKVIQQLKASFNNHDASAQANLFTEDADFYSLDGLIHVEGREKIERAFNYLHNGDSAFFKRALINSEIIPKIAFLAPNIACVTTKLSVIPLQEGVPAYSCRGVRVMVKKNGKWKIRTYMDQKIIGGEVFGFRVSSEDINDVTMDE